MEHARVFELLKCWRIRARNPTEGNGGKPFQLAGGRFGGNEMLDILKIKETLFRRSR